MIAANELRLGNWVDWLKPEPKPTYEQVYVLSENEINEDSPEYYNPIPLTSEILEALGFTKETAISEHYSGEGKSINLAYRIDGYDCDLVLTDSIGYGNEFQVWAEFKQNKVHIGIPITAVHQLQNIYFDLTGKELIYPLRAIRLKTILSP